MIEVQQRKRAQVGSCNACNVGKLSKDGKDLIYPYGLVHEITLNTGGLGMGQSLRLCGKCRSELLKKLGES